MLPTLTMSDFAAAKSLKANVHHTQYSIPTISVPVPPHYAPLFPRHLDGFLIVSATLSVFAYFNNSLTDFNFLKVCNYYSV